jgi:small neutral amino acid transporter SnatA (MarC family)
MLLNPFLVIIYLLDLVKKQSVYIFSKNLFKASIFSAFVFSVFAILGDSIFQNIVKAHFASFQIFGGIIFLLIGIQFIMKGNSAIDGLRGDSEDVSSSIAIPVLIGPGTISASVIMGKKLPPLSAVAGIAGTVMLSAVIMILLKCLHDYIHPKKERIIEKYIEIAGRIMALYIGTVSIEMIMNGMSFWIKTLKNVFL